jgi:hypothetical protein
MSAVKVLWVVEWTWHYDDGRSRKMSYSFVHAGTAQAFIDGNHEGLRELRSSLSTEDAATLTLKRAPFADRLEGWLKALRKHGIRSRKNLSQAAMNKMDSTAPTVFHTGYQGYAYEAWDDEVYRKNSGCAVSVLHFNHDNMTPAHYQTMRDLLEAYSLPYAWSGTEWQNIQIITPHGRKKDGLLVCDFCDEMTNVEDSEVLAPTHDGGVCHLMCAACREVNE